MNEFIEKIIEKLEELRQIEYDREDYIDEDGLYNDCEEAFADGESNGRYQAYVRIMKFILEIEKKYNNGWIPCSERLPSKEECGTYGSGEFQVTIPQYDGNKTTVMDYEYTTVRGKEVSRWKWNGRVSPWEVIAWKPLSEPFKEE